jgi:SAM-dependent methyltransferase
MAERDHDEPPRVCDYEGSDYQTVFWDAGERAYEDGAEAIALRRMLPASGKLLLEIGAGAGRNTPRYAGYERIVVMDYSTTQLKQAQANLGTGDRYIYVVADVYRLPFVDGLFDAATMIRVIHHIADVPLALAHIHAVMQPAGVFILEYANKLNLKAILRHALGRQDWNPYTLDPVEFVELNFNFHPRAIREGLAEAGFAVRRQLSVSHFRIPLFKRWLPASLLVWMDSIASLTGDLWQLSPSVFVRAEAGVHLPLAPAGSFFKCPACNTALNDQHNDHIACPNCGARYPIQDGIYNFKGTV